MNEVPTLITVVAAIASVIVTIVSLKVLKDVPMLSNPVIAIGIGGLSFIGLHEFCKDWAPIILLPYVVTAISIIAILLFLPFLKDKKLWDGNDIRSADRGENRMGKNGHEDFARKDSTQENKRQLQGRK
jgi:hypothetical protein